ncbi:MAG: YidC/Oxa1 family membrane protein insertase, partial [Acholeplasmataceae bacterium]
MNKRIIFIVMMLILTLSLAACNSSDDNIASIAVNNPYGENGEKVVFEYDEQDQIVFKGENGLSYWTVNEVGVPTLVTYDGDLPTSTTEENGIRTYYFSVENETQSFKIYIKPEVPVEDNTIVMLAIRYSEENVSHHIGKTFNPIGMEVYAIEKDGDIQALHETLSEDAFIALFDDYDYQPLDDDGFKDKISYPVSVTYQGVSEEFNIYVAGGERPVTTEDANVFDWIFVIPISYIMAFFGGLMGNSFALGILFTTIVVRTLAWPIYAKSNDMSLKMNLAQPDMQRVQMKYATRKDPASQQQMQ